MESEGDGETLWDSQVDGWLTNSRSEFVEGMLAGGDLDVTASTIGKRRLSVGGASEQLGRIANEATTGSKIGHGRSSDVEAVKRVRQKTFSSDGDECTVAMDEQRAAGDNEQVVGIGEDDCDAVVATGGALKVPVKVVLMGKRIAFMCTLCKAMCNNGDNLMQHLRGKKHGNRERKALQARLMSSAPHCHTSLLGQDSKAVASGSQSMKESADGVTAPMDSDCLQEQGADRMTGQKAAASGSTSAKTPSAVVKPDRETFTQEGTQPNHGRRKAGKRQHRPANEQNRVEGQRRKLRGPRSGNGLHSRTRKAEIMEACAERKTGQGSGLQKAFVVGDRGGAAITSAAGSLVHSVGNCTHFLDNYPKFAMVVFLYDETIGRGRDWRVALPILDNQVNLLSRCGEDGGNESWVGGVAALEIENHGEPNAVAEALSCPGTQRRKKASQSQPNSEEAAAGGGVKPERVPSSPTSVKRGRGGGRGGGRGAGLILRERTCFICRKLMEGGEEVAALLNITEGDIACKSRNRQGFFHVFHKDCLRDWVSLCLRRAAMTEAQVASPSSRSGSGMVSQLAKEMPEPAEERQQEQISVMHSDRQQGAENADAMDEGTNRQAHAGTMAEEESLVPWEQAPISGPFCPECQGTGIKLPGGELEHPRHRLNQVFGWILELVQARKMARDSSSQEQQLQLDPSSVPAYAAGSPELFAALEASRSVQQRLGQEHRQQELLETGAPGH